MFDQLIHFDHQLFFAINRDLSNPFFDWLMPFLRDKYFWVPLYLFIIIYLIRSYGRAGILLIIFILATFAVTDTVSSKFIKPFAERPRPCNDPTVKSQANLLISCGTGYSFPSSHASNHFGLALILITILYRKWKWILPVGILWASIICFAQVYCGVHYPLDVTGGAILGSVIGYLAAIVFRKIQFKNGWNPGN